MAVHEAGHAVAHLYYEIGTPERITIASPEGGIVTWRIDELHDQTEEKLLAVLVATLAGRAAEKEILGSVGASLGGSRASDLAIATDLAFQMEASMGFSREWPLLYRQTDERTLLLALDAALTKSVYARLTVSHRKALDLARQQQEAIEFLAKQLLMHGNLEGATLAELVEKTRERMVE